MRLGDLLAILAIAAACYVAVPAIAAAVRCRYWAGFRGRAADSAKRPVLDYAAARALDAEGSDFRFYGRCGSAVDGGVVWVRGPDLTIPVDLSKAAAYVLQPPPPGAPGRFGPGPVRVEGKRAIGLGEEAKIFIAGRARSVAGTPRFLSDEGSKLIAIFYEGPDSDIAPRAAAAGRENSALRNPATLSSVALGIFGEVALAATNARRPALGPAVSAALAAAALPLLVFLPPALPLTNLARRWTRRARFLATCADLARAPLEFLGAKGYAASTVKGWKRRPPAGIEAMLPAAAADAVGADDGNWICFGSETGEGGPPGRPDDPALPFGALPGLPDTVAKRLRRKAALHRLEAGAAILAGAAVSGTAAFLLMEAFR